MTEIKVIIDTGRAIDLEAMSQEERAYLIEQVGEENPDIPRSIIDSFIDLQTEVINKRLMNIQPELKELLLRKIIQLSQGHGSELNTIVIPILQTRGGNTLISTGAGKRFRQGRENNFTGPATLAPNAIAVRFDDRVLCSLDSREYIAAPNEELGIVGIVVNDFCSHPDTLGHNESRSHSVTPVTSIVVCLPTCRHIYTLGTYGFRDIARACDEYFISAAKSIRNVTEDGQPVVIFSEDAGNDNIMSKIFKRIIAHNVYIDSHEAALIVHSQLRIYGEKLSGPFANIVISPRPYMRMKLLEKPPLLAKLEGMIRASFDVPFVGARLQDVFARGLGRAYFMSLDHGADFPEVIAELSRYKAWRDKTDFQIKLREKALAEKNKISIYKTIITRKLGTARMAEIDRKHVIQTLSELLKLLTPAERRAVELEYERREKYIDAVLNNKCEHVPLLKKLRRAVSDEQMKASLDRLRGFFKSPTLPTDSYITCRVCGFDIICPHALEMTELELAQAKYVEVKARLTKYIDAASRDQYFCKICGEIISPVDILGDVGSYEAPQDDELRNFIWNELIMLMKYLKFNAVINVPALVSSMRDTIYPFIFEIEKQILKSKTITADEIKAKKRLYVTIYGMAYILHLVSFKRGAPITLRDFQPTGKNPLVDAIKHVISIITLSRNIIIREIPGMTTDMIKNILIDAYKIIQIQEAEAAPQIEAPIASLIMDPIFKYLYYINTMDGINAKKQYDVLAKRGSTALPKAVDFILGSPLSVAEKRPDLYIEARLPNFRRWNLRTFDELTSADVIGKKSLEQLIKDVLPGYIARSFELFYNKIEQRLYDVSMFVDITAAKGRHDVELQSRLSNEHQRAYDKYLTVYASENVLMLLKRLLYAKNFIKTKFELSRQFVYQKLSLGRIFDENGNLHNFNILIIIGADNKEKEIHAADINKEIESGKRFTGRIVDKKCNICGIRQNEAAALDETKIREALHVKYELSNFFRFYENRCPSGGLHVMTQDTTAAGICKKCGFRPNFLIKDSKERLEYYKKYAKNYAEERRELARSDTAAIVSTTYPPLDVSKYDYEYRTWALNFNIILELATALKVNHRILSALGAIEKNEWTDVQSGAYIPPEASSRNDTRIYCLAAHIKNLITEWNQLRFFHRLVKPSAELVNLVDESNIPRQKMAEISKLLPDVYNDFNERLSYFQRNKKPRETAQFCVETFCYMCLKIWNDPTAETERLRRNFVSYFVNKVIRNEEMLTKPGYFSWAILYDDKEVREREAYDINYVEAAESEYRVRELGEKLAPSDFGDTNAPLLSEDLDVETDPDAEPDDDQDTGQIRVEGYGLD